MTWKRKQNFAETYKILIAKNIFHHQHEQEKSQNKINAMTLGAVQKPCDAL